jgi:hypothetical protein
MQMPKNGSAARNPKPATGRLDFHDKGLSRENTLLPHSMKEFPEASPWTQQWPADLRESIRFASANAAA